ncbi:MAG: T9SS type A sorting domain-containing protein [Flavobacteriales bacterium]|nr:T9SS type A sorting domain-containing protein [Flavobacteriales bacterium]
MTKLLVAALVLCSGSYFAQCGVGLVEVTIEVSTDNWGYEQYWELLPDGNACGSAPIFTGGNTTELNCSSGGAPYTANTGNGYGSNTTIVEGPWCLTDGLDYDIYFVDDYGDGGAEFEVTIAGYPIYNFGTSSTNERFSFTAAGPFNLDAELTSISIPGFAYAGNVGIAGSFTNVGITTITSIDVNYTIDGGTAITENLAGLSIAPFNSYNFTHATPWNATSVGTYTVDVFVSNVNGATDDNSANDNISKFVTINPAIPNIMADYIAAPTGVVYDVIGTAADQVNAPRDLDFSPSGDLWSINTNTESSGGSTIKWTNPGEASQTELWQRDANAYHFMSLPTAIAFSDNGTFGTSPGVYDANHDGGLPFTGPSLWSSDPAIYAQPSGGNGSHLDMLHASPYGMGMASVTANEFFVFDANSNDIVFYDFVLDHGPGNSYHGDAIIRRYTGLTVSWINVNVSSHMEMAPNTDWLYIVDGGNQRVMRLDISSGTVGGTPTNFNNPEAIAEYSTVNGATFESVVTTGLVQPSGIDIIDDRMIITDHSNGDIIIYDISAMPATELTRISTGNPGIQGTVIGPDGSIWFANATDNEIVKVQTAAAASIDENALELGLTVFPNPTEGNISVKSSVTLNNAQIKVTDVTGKIVFTDSQLVNNRLDLNLSHLSGGIYYLTVSNDGLTATKKIVIQ